MKGTDSLAKGTDSLAKGTDSLAKGCDHAVDTNANSFQLSDKVHQSVIANTKHLSLTIECAKLYRDAWFSV